MKKLNFENLCYEIAKLEISEQSKFIDSLRSVLTHKEIESLQIGIAYFRLLMDDKFKNAMKSALASELYKEFRKQIDS